MDVAAAIVGFVGLAGQVLQGCKFLHDFLGDVKDAPQTVLELANELGAFQDALCGLHSFLESAKISRTPRLLPDAGALDRTLRKCEGTIDGIIEYVTSRGPRPTSRSQKKRWQAFRTAFESDTLRRHHQRLNAAKTELLSIQSGLVLAFHLETLQLVNDSKQALVGIQHSADLSRQESAKRDALLQDEYATLKVMLSTTNDIASTTQRGETSVAALSASVYQTTQSFDELNELINGLPAILASIMKSEIERTVQKSLLQHQRQHAETQSSTFNVDSRTESRFNGTQMRDVANSNDPSQNADRISGLITPSGRAHKRQQRSQSTYYTWFGRIEITTIATKKSERLHEEQTIILSANQTCIRILPNQRLIKLGLEIISGHLDPHLGDPYQDAKMRIFNLVDENAPIVRAILALDYVEILQLLKHRKATVFDVVKPGSELRAYKWLGDETVDLLTVLLCNFERRCGLSSKETGHLYQIVRLFLTAGLDCGGAMYACCKLLWKWNHHRRSACSTALRDPNLLQLFLEHASTDPVDHILPGTMVRTIPLAWRQTIPKQERWDLSELNQRLMKHYGLRFWQQGLRLEESPLAFELRQVMTNAWKDAERRVRRSKEACLLEFGSEFVRFEWPELYWSEEKPSFWASRDECHAFFGERFTAVVWPELRWRAEKPRFWRSKTACAVEFGRRFVKYHWSSLVWEELPDRLWRTSAFCFGLLGLYPTNVCTRRDWPIWRGWDVVEELEGPGSWSDVFEECEGQGSWSFENDSWGLRVRHWSPNLRSGWRLVIMQRWKAQEICERHSRAHCLKTCGISFTQEEWPRLLKEDGVSDAEIAYLTAEDQLLDVEIDLIFGLDNDTESWRSITGEEWCTMCRSRMTGECWVDHRPLSQQAPGAWPSGASDERALDYTYSEGSGVFLDSIDLGDDFFQFDTDGATLEYLYSEDSGEIPQWCG